jgi:hypothetical protein
VSISEGVLDDLDGENSVVGLVACSQVGRLTWTPRLIRRLVLLLLCHSRKRNYLSIKEPARKCPTRHNQALTPSYASVQVLRGERQSNG